MEKRFDFINEVNKHYPDIKVVETTLKEIYNWNGSSGCSTEKTKKKGVYALFYENELKKIGKATDKNGGLTEINEQNRDKIKVLYFNPPEEECWFDERRLQVIAHDCGEEMPWENTSRN